MQRSNASLSSDTQFVTVILSKSEVILIPSVTDACRLPPSTVAIDDQSQKFIARMAQLMMLRARNYKLVIRAIV